MNLSLPKQAAAAALECFENLPERCKPRSHPDGRREWTPMSAIMVAKGDKVACVSLATGTKCLSHSAMPKCQGTVVHDSHAELLALRGFNRWLLNEMSLVLTDPAYSSSFLEHNGTDAEAPHLFKLKTDVSIHMFTTEAPCGDASMELLMASKAPEDAIPWSSRAQPVTVDGSEEMLGRGYFSELGKVRRKPGRADTEPSLSKSCTDKLSVKQFTGLLSFPADLLLEMTENVFLRSLIVYPDHFNGTGYLRAFGEKGRFLSNTSCEARHFEYGVLPNTFPRFAYEKPSNSAESRKASNVSAIWIRGYENRANATMEVLINGVKQGFKQFEEREAKESAVCRKQMWLTGQEIMLHLDAHRSTHPTLARSAAFDRGLGEVRKSLSSSTYADAKASSLRDARRFGKDSATLLLGSWPRNSGDEDWSIMQNRPCATRMTARAEIY